MQMHYNFMRAYHTFLLDYFCFYFFLVSLCDYSDFNRQIIKRYTMNISYNWLKRYLKADLEAERMAEILTELGLEVEEFEKIETIKGGLKGVVE